MTGFENRVLQTIRHFEMIEPGDSVAVALSGGPDSVALLAALLQIRVILRCELSAIHYHHNVRGGEADRDEEFVRDLCRRLEVPLRTGRRPEGSPRTGNLEDLLRTARYEYFRDQLAEAGTRLATGHTLDDQAETVLLKLVRGAAATGLAGIFPVREYGTGRRARLRLIRPLLRVTREQVVQYLEKRGFDYRSDSSNLDLTFDRNWVRCRLIPLIRERLNPQVAAALGRTAEFHRDLAESMAREAEQFLAGHSRRMEDELAIGLRALREMSPFRRRAVLREAARRTGSGNELGSEHVSQVESLLELQPGRRFEGPGELRVWREKDELVFSVRPVAEFEMKLSIPGEIYVQERGRRIRAWRATDAEVPPGLVAFELVANHFSVRNLRRGDCIHYTDSGGLRARKVAGMLREKGVPRRLQGGLLVFATETEILWVEGLGVNPGRKTVASGMPLVMVDIDGDE